MNFHSARFFILLAIALALYWRAHRLMSPDDDEADPDPRAQAGIDRTRRRLRLLVLAAASFIFYAAWDVRPLLVLSAYALVNRIAGRLLATLKPEGLRKLVLTVSVTLHLAGLILYKYVNLGIRTADDLLGTKHEPLALLVPIGLSFATFQAISYVVDVYRRQAPGRYSYLHHWVYLLFFPRVIAGPIVRASDLIVKFDRPTPPTREESLDALFRIAQGLAKKLLLADVLAATLVDPVYANPTGYSSVECVLATVAYTFQIYFDFSGYSDIALGASALFGFKLPENFDKPYHARNLFEFWNRWHVSLSTWLRDYFYRPMGGSRGSKLATLRNLFLVMALGGLWHGADWRFAVWGGLHGLFLVVLRIKWWRSGKPEYEKWHQAALGIFVTFWVVVFTRVFFRAESMTRAFEMFEQMLTFTWGLQRVSDLAWGSLGACVFFYVLPEKAFELTGQLFLRLPVPARAVVLVALGLLVKSVSTFETQPYIYRQF